MRGGKTPLFAVKGKAAISGRWVAEEWKRSSLALFQAGFLQPLAGKEEALSRVPRFTKLLTDEQQDEKGKEEPSKARCSGCLPRYAPE